MSLGIFRYFAFGSPACFALARRASKRGSPCRDFKSGSDAAASRSENPCSIEWRRYPSASSRRPAMAAAQAKLYQASASPPASFVLRAASSASRYSFFASSYRPSWARMNPIYSRFITVSGASGPRVRLWISRISR
jgi:hypothetical protein